jgi:hypothetical protein
LENPQVWTPSMEVGNRAALFLEVPLILSIQWVHTTIQAHPFSSSLDNGHIHGWRDKEAGWLAKQYYTKHVCAIHMWSKQSVPSGQLLVLYNVKQAGMGSIVSLSRQTNQSQRRCRFQRQMPTID